MEEASSLSVTGKDACSTGSIHTFTFYKKMGMLPKSGVVSKALDNLGAISGVTIPLSFRIFERVFLETPRVVAISVMVKDKGSK